MIIETKLYQQIRQMMPIPCVDVAVTDGKNRVLLLKRNNPPAAGQWWFPGGRVYFMEKRKDAALRKLREECGLTTTHAHSLGTFDVFFTRRENDGDYHGITTLFHSRVKQTEITLDGQSGYHAWRTASEWLQESLHDFIKNGLILLLK